MSRNHRFRRSLLVFPLLAALLLMSLPAQAAAATPTPPALAGKVAALGEDALVWLRNLFSGLGIGAIAKEGVTIDPNGQPQPSPSSDEGMSIDPNGKP